MRPDPDFAEPIVAKPNIDAEPILAGLRRPMEDLALLMGWLVVCLINMIVPAIFGLLTTEKDGRHGMFLGVAAVFGLGILSFAGSAGREALRTVVYGAWAVAVPPIGPFLHIKAGQIGLGMAGTTGWKPSESVNTLSGGLIATLVTAGLLIALAGALGLIGRIIVYLLRSMWGVSESGD